MMQLLPFIKNCKHATTCMIRILHTKNNCKVLLYYFYETKCHDNISESMIPALYYDICNKVIIRACIMESEMPYFLVWSLSSSAWYIMRYMTKRERMALLNPWYKPSYYDSVANYVKTIIRKYGSTFYIRIAIIVHAGLFKPEEFLSGRKRTWNHC